MDILFVIGGADRWWLVHNFTTWKNFFCYMSAQHFDDIFLFTHVLWLDDPSP